MEARVIASELANLALQAEALRQALKSATDELKTQLAIILGNITGISERLDRLEQAHAELERQVLDMLTNTLPSSTERITQLERQVKDHFGESLP